MIAVAVHDSLEVTDGARREADLERSCTDELCIMDFVGQERTEPSVLGSELLRGSDDGTLVLTMPPIVLGACGSRAPPGAR